MKKYINILIGFFVVFAFIMPLTVKAETVVVKKGDNLTKISKKTINKPKQIMAMNRDKIKDINLLYPKQKLTVITAADIQAAKNWCNHVNNSFDYPDLTDSDIQVKKIKYDGKDEWGMINYSVLLEYANSWKKIKKQDKQQKYYWDKATSNHPFLTKEQMDKLYNPKLEGYQSLLPDLSCQIDLGKIVINLFYLMSYLASPF